MVFYADSSKDKYVLPQTEMPRDKYISLALEAARVNDRKAAAILYVGNYRAWREMKTHMPYTAGRIELLHNEFLHDIFYSISNKDLPY